MQRRDDMDRPAFPLTLKDPALLQTRSYIDGQWMDARDGSRFAVDNPATGTVIAEVANLDVAETAGAIDAAKRAFGPWSARTGKDRATLLRRWFDLIIENTDDLARLMTLEQGKPLAEARGEVVYAASFVEWFAEQAKRVMGDTMASPVASNRMLVF